jgi:hypothetical protein
MIRHLVRMIAALSLLTYAAGAIAAGEMCVSSGLTSSAEQRMPRDCPDQSKVHDCAAVCGALCAAVTPAQSFGAHRLQMRQGIAVPGRIDSLAGRDFRPDPPPPRIA